MKVSSSIETQGNILFCECFKTECFVSGTLFCVTVIDSLYHRGVLSTARVSITDPFIKDL